MLRSIPFTVSREAAEVLEEVDEACVKHGRYISADSQYGALTKRRVQNDFGNGEIELTVSDEQALGILMEGLANTIRVLTDIGARAGAKAK